ncbi:conserved membrane hypothetical protein [Hyphomicrobiales bacterium]|nr:conserved membrane hypothetical protein [Hyphomicrobiales bacterium]CAH1700874.1 conserved membrane hypothetical protein [Hyphomicrobiales bacterium]CAI0344750.1 conserved membrane hypothetical protein [Hyphomicrobiales bacterium]
MIAIFTVLGLVLFGGGAYAIYDGWPYLVLERGFTQVIIGSIATSAGLILLSLSWVLRELGALKRSLAEAAQARAEPAAQAALDSARALRERIRPEEIAESGTPLVPAAIGAAAGAVVAGAVVNELARPAGETAAAAPEIAPVAERDLFGSLVARELDQASDEVRPEERQEAPALGVVEPLPDMFQGTSFARFEDAPVAVETESHEPAEIVSAKIQPVGEDEALAHAVEPFLVPPAPSAERAPEFQADEPEEDAPAGASSDADEFSALRESLAGHLNEPAGSDSRIEPSLAPEEEDPFAEAEAWMDRASPRREPWFEPPAASDPSDVAAPSWPPRTEAPAFPPAPEPVAEPEAEDEKAPSTDEFPADREEQAEPATAEGPAGEDVSGEALPADTSAEPEPPAPQERAASDEGIVGAYQVGDAHFTIYADGSIRARTPDGEFSFASMDELKAYLASEKNRLGV